MILWILDLGAEDGEGQRWTGDLRDIRLRQALIHSFPNGGDLEAIPYSSFFRISPLVYSPPKLLRGLAEGIFSKGNN